MPLNYSDLQVLNGRLRSTWQMTASLPLMLATDKFDHPTLPYLKFNYN